MAPVQHRQHRGIDEAACRRAAAPTLAVLRDAARRRSPAPAPAAFALPSGAPGSLRVVRVPALVRAPRPGRPRNPGSQLEQASTELLELQPPQVIDPIFACQTLPELNVMPAVGRQSRPPAWPRNSTLLAEGPANSRRGPRLRLLLPRAPPPAAARASAQPAAVPVAGRGTRRSLPRTSWRSRRSPSFEVHSLCERRPLTATWRPFAGRLLQLWASLPNAVTLT